MRPRSPRSSSLRPISSAAALGASDVHMRAGQPPLFRLNGELLRSPESGVLPAAHLETLAMSLLTPAQKERLERDHEVDVAWQVPNAGRCRASVFRQRGTIGLALRLLDFVVAVLQQLLDDVFHVLADITGLGEGGGIGHHEGHIQHARQGLRQQGLAGTGGANQQDVALGELDIVLFGFFLVTQALVVVVDRHRQGALGDLLANDVVVQIGLDLGRGGQVALGLTRQFGLGQLIADDLVAQIDAFIADEHRGTGDQFLDLVLALAAKRAVEGFFALRTLRFCHVRVSSLVG